jgi:hypothetical protein
MFKANIHEREGVKTFSEACLFMFVIEISLPDGRSFRPSGSRRSTQGGMISLKSAEKYATV